MTIYDRFMMMTMTPHIILKIKWTRWWRQTNASIINYLPRCSYHLLYHNDMTAWRHQTLKWWLMTDLWRWRRYPTSFSILNDDDDETRRHHKKWRRHDDLVVTIYDATSWHAVLNSKTCVTSCVQFEQYRDYIFGTNILTFVFCPVTVFFWIFYF